MPMLHEIRVDGNTVYAASDEGKFTREAAKYANVHNATLVPANGKKD